MASLNEKLKGIIAKVKSIKHIEIIIAVIVVALMILIFSGFKSSSSKTTSTDDSATSAVSTTNVSTVAEWEKRLAEILSSIDGVGKAEVMITAKSTTEKVTANTTTTSISSSQGGSGNVTTSTNTTETPVIVNNNGTSEPYILKEVMPEILGVIVVAEGADNSVTKLAIMRAVQTSLQVNAACVEIYPMK